MPKRISIVKLDPESPNSLESFPDPIQRGPDDIGCIIGQRKLSEPPSGRQSSGQVVINPHHRVPSPPLLGASPLRSGRDSFPSYGSGPSNACFGETRFRDGKMLAMNPVVALWMK